MMRIHSIISASALGASLAGCGTLAGSPERPASNPPVTVARGAWISPEAKSHSLLYVSDPGTASVDVFTYPAMKEVGLLVGFTEPYTMCVNAAQDVYVPDLETSRVTEYAHGSITPMRTLDDHQGSSVGCAVDPKTGDLAVSNDFGPSSTPGNVIVYKGAKGTPTKYEAPGFTVCLFIGYDDAGNLFVDGYNPSAVLLAELPSGGSAFKSISMNQKIGFPGGVAWDGEFLAVGDQLANTIYQFKVSGSKATEQGSTVLSGAVNVVQFWFTGRSAKHPQATAVVGADASGDAAKWQYPAGGTPVKTIPGLSTPVGAVVSK
jgi:hypothetical protein